MSDELRGYLAVLDADLISPGTAATLYGLFADIRRLASAGEMLVARKASEAATWREGGHRNPATWMAATSGIAVGEAVSSLETAERLGSLPATTDALRCGAVSTQEAKEIAAVAATRPEVEAELLAVAEGESMKTLKERCRRVGAQCASAEEEAARSAAVHAGRYFRHWSDPDGAFRGAFKLTPDQGAVLLSSIEARADVLFDEARKNDIRDSPAAYAADALVDLVSRSTSGRGSGDGAGGSRGGRRANTVVHIRADSTALRRGHVSEGEVCEIAGVGPVSVRTVKALLPEAFVKLLITDGVDVVTVCHVGRSISAHLRSAIEERDPTCVVPGCDVATGLEIDHWETDFALGGPTTMANLARLCHFHHAQKTYNGFELRGGPGKWDWEPPPPFDSS